MSSIIHICNANDRHLHGYWDMGEIKFNTKKDTIQCDITLCGVHIMYAERGIHSTNSNLRFCRESDEWNNGPYIPVDHSNCTVCSLLALDYL